jgi:hypothetical protein
MPPPEPGKFELARSSDTIAEQCPKFAAHE